MIARILHLVSGAGLHSSNGDGDIPIRAPPQPLKAGRDIRHGHDATLVFLKL
jgi:hypothetical protein